MLKLPSSAFEAELRASGRPSWGAVAMRAAVTAGVLAALLLWLPLEQLLASMARLPAGLWLTTLIAFAAGHGVAAWKWRLLVRASGVPASLGEALRAHAAGLFANLCLPSLVGGDLLRAGMLIRRHGRPEAIAVASLADRILDTLGLLALAALGAASIPRALEADTRLALAASLLLGAALLAAVALLVALPHVPTARLPARLAPTAARASEALQALRARPALTLACLLTSLAIQAGFVALNAALGAAIGLELAFAVWLLAWPLAKLVALAPVSLGGIGVREAALASLLLPFGVAPALAVAQSLIWETLLVVLGLCAGLAAFWLGNRSDARSQPAARGKA